MPALTIDSRQTQTPALDDLLATIVAEHLAGATPGHCVRVNHLQRSLAAGICARLASQQSVPGLTSALLAQPGDMQRPDTVTADRAIEIRNRKEGVFCLFVPASTHDTTASSLGNSFAEINGPDLIEAALRRFAGEHASDRTGEILVAVNRVFATVNTSARPATIDRLHFALAAWHREQAGDGDRIGLELWRLGLVPDARPDFDSDLRRNRQAVAEIARPARLMASTLEKVAKLRLTPAATNRVTRLLQGQNHHNPKEWCRALLDVDQGTFDHWAPLDNVPANCNEVRITPFRLESGNLNPRIKGLRIDGPGGPLFAEIGDRAKLRFAWETDPRNTTVPRWLLEIVPADPDAELDDLAFDLPSVEVKKGTQRTGAIPLDLGVSEDDVLPRIEFQVRVSAISEAGETLVNAQDEPIVAHSDGFFFDAAEAGTTHAPARERNRSSSTLAEGMLRAVALQGASPGTIGSPAWTPGSPTTFFTMRATPKDVIRIPFNQVLDQLQDKTLANPDALGLWTLRQPDATIASIGDVRGTVSPTSETDEESSYLRARKALFAKIRAQEIRNRIEVIDWSADLIELALAHARAWVRWLDAVAGDDLRVARSVDTLEIRIGTEDQQPETARIVLPTHPLRTLWFASHATLLASWMTRLEDIAGPQRRQAVDLEALAKVLPTNVPPLLHHPGTEDAFVFYRNLDAGHGVAFPAGTLNPGEQFATLGTILGYTDLDPISEGQQPQRAAMTTQRFGDAHPYADPFKLALVNPDDGTFAEQMLRQWEHARTASQRNETDPDEEDIRPLPGLFITSYSRQRRPVKMLRGLERRRQTEEARITLRRSDHLRPSLSVVETDIDQLVQSDPESTFSSAHHMALVQDITQSAPRGYPTRVLEGAGAGLGLHGLITRLSQLHQWDGDRVRWLHWIDTSRKATAHPIDKRLADTMLDAHRAASDASGRLLDATLVPGENAFAAIGVFLDTPEIDLLRAVHVHADWVLTIDRFFGADLFDTPRNTVLGPDHRTYILDVSPDFQDGMGHRSLVTTSSRDEVEAILGRAMGQFGFDRLNDSVGSLIQTLKMVSGRLVLDALQTDARAREVVALGAVVTWLRAQGELRDTIIVPVDSHLDLFRPGTSDTNPDQKRCDLALFRFVQNRLTITLVEVKSRSSLADLDTLADTMVAQMDATSTVIEHRYFNDEFRVDGILQRSLLAHVLRFYLERAERYGVIEPKAAGTIRGKIDILEAGKVQPTLRQHGYVLALEQAPTRTRIPIGGRSEIRVLTIAEIARAARDITVKTPFPVPDEGSGDSPESPPSPVAAPGEDGDSPEAPHSRPSTHSAGAGTEPASPRPEATGNGEAIAQDIVLGDAANSPITWQPRTTGSPHLFILGIPGQGKTVTTERILSELATSRTPALVLDFHGTLANPDSAYAQAARPALLDAADGLPFSPFAIDPHSSWMQVQAHAKEIADVIDHVFGLGPIQADAVFTTIRDLYQRHGYGAAPGDGEQLPEPPTFAEVSTALTRRQKEQGVRNVLARTRALFDFGLFRPPLPGAPSFDDLLRQGVVIGLNRLGGEELALALSAFLLRSIYLSMTGWPTADRIRLVIVLDEAHKLARDITLPKIMKEGRKYGVAVVVASQGLADFHDDVIGNAGTKVSFRINNPDSRKVSKFFTTRPGQDLAGVLERLVPGQALLQTPEMPYAVRARMRSSEPGAGPT